MGDADLALGHGEASEAIHHEQDMIALAAKGIGDGQSHLGGPDAHQRRIVTCGDDDHRFAQPLAEAILDERPDLAAAFADEGDDIDLGIGSLGDFAEKRAFTDAAAGEDADALPASTGDEAVDGAHVRLKHLANSGARRGDGAVSSRCGIGNA